MPPCGGALGFCIVGGSIAVCETDGKAGNTQGDERMEGGRWCPLAVKN